MNKSRTLPLPAPWILLLGIGFQPAASAQVEIIGGGDPGALLSPVALSADGEVIVGSIYQSGVNGSLAYRFSDAAGFETLGTINGTSALPVAISDDGRYTAGNVSNSRAVRWGEDGVALDLGSLGLFDTRATAISGDGAIVVGSAQISQFNPPYRHAFRWTEAGGMVDAHPAFSAPTASSDATHISGDGTVVVGWANVSTPSGIDQRTAYRWTAAGGAIDIGNGFAVSTQALSVSGDGSVVAGIANGGFGGPPPEAWVWTAATGMVSIGEVEFSSFTHIQVSADGSTVYGTVGSDAFRWTQAGGRMDFTGPLQFSPRDSSDDGLTLAGTLWDGVNAPVAAYWTPPLGATALPGVAFSSTSATLVDADAGVFVGGANYNGLSLTARWRLDGTIGSTYCAPAVANSASATGASLSLGGTNRSASTGLDLSVTDLPQESFGFFIAARERDVVAMPGGSQGTLCLGGSIGRFVGPGQIQNSGQGGAFTLTIDPQVLPGPGGPVLPSFGDTWHFQAWYRDANPGATSNFSSAATVRIF